MGQHCCGAMALWAQHRALDLHLFHGHQLPRANGFGLEDLELGRCSEAVSVWCVNVSCRKHREY
jgi:hypothetical protein